MCSQGLKIYGKIPYTNQEQLTTMKKASGAKMKHNKPAAIQKWKTKQFCIIIGDRNGKVMVLKEALQHEHNHPVTEHETSLHDSKSLWTPTMQLPSGAIWNKVPKCGVKAHTKEEEEAGYHDVHSIFGLRIWVLSGF